MTEKEWGVELAAALVGTDWAIKWYGVVDLYSTCLASVHHHGMNITTQVSLSRDVFLTPEIRKDELRRRLSI